MQENRQYPLPKTAHSFEVGWRSVMTSTSTSAGTSSPSTTGVVVFTVLPTRYLIETMIIGIVALSMLLWLVLIGAVLR